MGGAAVGGAEGSGGGVTLHSCLLFVCVQSLKVLNSRSTVREFSLFSAAHDLIDYSSTCSNVNILTAGCMFSVKWIWSTDMYCMD